MAIALGAIFAICIIFQGFVALTEYKFDDWNFVVRTKTSYAALISVTATYSFGFIVYLRDVINASTGWSFIILGPMILLCGVNMLFFAFVFCYSVYRKYAVQR